MKHTIKYPKHYVRAAFDADSIDWDQFDVNERNAIEQGLEQGLDVSWYADPRYEWHQMMEIRNGLEQGVDVSWYADPKYNFLQMDMIRRGLKDGIDVSQYADPKYTSTQMTEIYKRLISGIEFPYDEEDEEDEIDETQVGDKFSYNVAHEDPADWSIDFPDFFDAIYEAVRDLGLEVEDEEEDLGESHYIYTLSNGCTINTYDLETDILYALADGDISSDGQLEYITNWISDACK